MRILVIEHDADIAIVLERRLARERFNVLRTDSGEEGVDLVRHFPFDLALLDPMLPDESGETVLRRLKLVSARLPVLIFSEDASIDTLLHFFKLGADDYVTKPCHGDELIARVRSIIRRTNGNVIPKVQIGELSIDVEAREVRVDGRSVRLSPREYQVLEFLALRLGTTVTQEELLTEMYDGVEEPDSRVIDQYVYKIRRKIDAAAPGIEVQIKTIRGLGYILEASREDLLGAAKD